MNLEQIEKARANLPEQLEDGRGGAADPDIDAGRNIRAGYVRGVGLEFGGLHPVIDSDPDWIAAWEVARHRSIVSHHRLMNLFLIIKYSNIPDGNIIEFGSYQGGCALLMAILAKRCRRNCKVFALDTFEGMPQVHSRLDRHVQGNFGESKLNELRNLKEELQLDNLIIKQGYFQDSVKEIAAEDRKFFLSHVDCDIYESVHFSIEFSKRHAVPGSYIVCDDPLTADCLGAMKALEQTLIMNGCHAEQAYPHLVYRYPPLG